MKLFALRGATTVVADTEQEIKEKSMELIEKMIASNNLKTEDLVSLLANTTNDIKAAYPVRFVRESRIMSDIAVFSCTEPDIKGGLKLCIRYILHVQKENDFVPTHIYLHNARVLRKDLCNK